MRQQSASSLQTAAAGLNSSVAMQGWSQSLPLLIAAVRLREVDRLETAHKDAGWSKAYRREEEEEEEEGRRAGDPAKAEGGIPL